jgi:Protein of unknown function (DUF1588)/Protein of unknown function (DUF1592)/Protein of unknown function (DUF1587)/Protein of unknown function (DUF1585)/Protein of unknown function (DUF1595)/Planctomycete cytochrome C
MKPPVLLHVVSGFTVGVAIVVVNTLAVGVISPTESHAASTVQEPSAPAKEPAESAASVMAFDFVTATEFMSDRCADCHGGDEHEGEFRLDTIGSEESLSEHFKLWNRIRTRVADGSMPPSEAEPLTQAERESLAGWIEGASLDCICGQSPPVGPAVTRRMTRIEYANTIRDLLGVHFNAAATLPEDMAGGEGFTNAAETLIISPIHAERFLDAATEALSYATSDSRSRSLLFPVQPGDNLPPVSAARENVRRLANRAFRRPVGDDELAVWFRVCDRLIADGATHEVAAAQAMKGILISPQFLFLAEVAPVRPGTPEALTDHELATRLSYFLWTSMPDDKLRSDADAGRLREPAVLKSHVERMISQRGTHLRDSMGEFVGQWLGTADLGVSRQVDRAKHPEMTDPHVAGLRNQPVYYFEELLKTNESLLQLIDSDWTFLNNELCRVYRINQGKLGKKFVQNLVRVPLPEAYRNRGGILAMGGVHAVASYPRRSSPVLRGTWVLERLLGVELPPPPADVPALDDSAKVVAAQTLRQRFEQHRSNPACATCHDRIDPIGFALENFDEIGRWRDKDDGGPIDAVAITSDGRTIEGIDGLKSWLLDHRRKFLTQLTRKMLGYALGRSLNPTDLCTVRDVVERLENEDYKAQTLVLGIVESDVFRMKQ